MLQIQDIPELRDFQTDPEAERVAVLIGTRGAPQWKDIITAAASAFPEIHCACLSKVLLYRKPSADRPAGEADLSFSRASWRRRAPEPKRPFRSFYLLCLYSREYTPAARLRELELRLCRLFDSAPGVRLRFAFGRVPAPGESPRTGGMLDRIYRLSTPLYRAAERDAAA